MPHTKMITFALPWLHRVLAFTRRCLRRIGNNRAQAPVRPVPRIRIGRKAGKKSGTCVTVRDVNMRLHRLLHVPAQKASRYVREGCLQDDWVHRMVVGYPRLPYTRSRADMWYSTWLYMTNGRMYTIRCKHNEAERLLAHALAVAEQGEVQV